ncbi:MAG: DUF3467 domain-containing protein [Pseudonocardiaceae bacterium]
MASDDQNRAAGWTDDTAENFYTNAMMVAAGPFDVTLVFGHQDHAHATAGAQPVSREVARVAMSWAHLKSMLPLLAKLVASYETQFGEIPAPGFEENWKE